MRTFSLVEGTSDKFWSIDVVNTSVTVNYGRTGTKGQTKTTEYESAAKATAESATLIAAKVRKGYVEGTATGSLTPAAVASQASAPPARASAPATPPAPVTPPEALAPGAWSAADDLLITPNAMERALLGVDPLDLTPDATEFDSSGLASWLRENTTESNPYRHDLTFLALPFEGVPSARAATWWLRFGRKRPTGTWSRRATPTLRERLAFAETTDDEGHGDLSTPWHEYDLPPSVLVGCLLALMEPRQVIRSLLPAAALSHDGWPALLPALRAYVVPFLTPSDRVLPAIPEPTHNYHRMPPEWGALMHALASAALFGDEGAIRAAYEDALAAGTADPSPELTVAAVVGLSDPSERLRWLQHSGVGHAVGPFRAFLVFGGPGVLPTLLTALDHEYTDKVQATAMMRVLSATAAGPALAATMVALSGHLRAKPEAVAWLAAHPREVAASGFSATAAQRETLTAVVRDLTAASPDAFGPDPANPTIAAILDELAAEAALPTLNSSDAPAWFQEAVAAEATQPVEEGPLKVPSKAPSWAQPSALPPLIVAGARLDADLTAAVLASAAAGVNSASRAPRPLVAAVRDHMSAKDRDTFAVPLMQAFLTAGAKTGERAYFLAAGYLGAEGFTFALTPLVREWPGQSQHQRAVLGLEVLAATGTAAALQSISGIANKSKFKGVQKAAQEALAKLAALQGLTVDQLEDRVVPDADLDARGVRVLSYGPRSFRVSLSPQGKAVVRDLDADGRPTGKPRTALPAPNSKDDAEQAALAKAEFTVLRKQLTEVAKIQTARLEKALVTGRTWTATEHRTLVAEHPVLNSLIRPLVWQVTAEGQPSRLVRVTEDHEYIDASEDAIEIPADAVVRLAHPLHIGESERAAWRTQLVDFDLVAPLEQLDRRVYGLPAGQAGTKLAGLPTGTVNPGTLVSTLERLGWRRGNPADAGVVNYLWLPFESLGLAAVLSISDGLWTGMILESGDQRLEDARLGPIETVRNLWYVDDRGTTWLPWEQADPVLVSEVRRSLSTLEEKMA